jgi:hypothetical protein
LTLFKLVTGERRLSREKTIFDMSKETNATIAKIIAQISKQLSKQGYRVLVRKRKFRGNEHVNN